MVYSKFAGTELEVEGGEHVLLKVGGGGTNCMGTRTRMAVGMVQPHVPHDDKWGCWVQRTETPAALGRAAAL